MGRKSQSKHNGKEKVDKDRIRRVKQLFGLSERILRLTTEYAGTDAFSRHESMVELLDQVLAQERTVEPANNKKQRTENLATFVAWLKENEAQFEGVEISEFEGYELGLRATRDFPTGSLVLTVPRKLMMTDEDADKSSLAPYIHKDPLLSTMPNVALALFLLLEKHNPNSFWKPYLDILPERYTTVLYFTTEELKELKPSPVLEQALKLCRSIARQYAYIYTKIHADTSPAHPLRSLFTYDAYRWAVSTVMTRQNSVVGRVGFIPLWDMCNHEHGTITTDYSVESERSECFALREFKAGEQVFIFYGVRSNADLFLHNGFVYPGNRQDSVSLHLGVSSDDRHCAARLALLARLGLGAHTHYCLHTAPHAHTHTPLSPEVLAFARIISMKPEELTGWGDGGERDSSLLVSDQHSDLDLDKRAYTFLLTRCSLIVATYGKCDTTQQQLSVHRRNVQLLKQTELKILTDTAEHCRRILTHLHQQPQQ